MKLEDHIQLSHSGVDHYQNELQHAQTITLDASLNAAWPCKANVKPTSRHTFHTLLSGFPLQRWPQDNIGSPSAFR